MNSSIPETANISLSAISLFSGAGGMDIGVKQAGFDIKACIEIDKHCCRTLRENIQREKRDTLVYEGDIRFLAPEQILSDIHKGRGEVDLLFGGLLVKHFLKLGNKNHLRTKGGVLLFQMVRYAKVIQPRAIMIEQVKGLLTAKDLDGRRWRRFLSRS